MIKKSDLRRLRKLFNSSVRKRDKYCCKLCGCSDKLKKVEVHHITDRHEMPNDGYAMENGITLCNDCHLDAEQFHWSHGTQWMAGKHPNDLYNLIGSSYDVAYKASEQLKNASTRSTSRSTKFD